MKIIILQWREDVRFSKIFTKSLTAIAVSIVFVSGQALAGFQWQPPVEAEQIQPLQDELMLPIEANTEDALPQTSQQPEQQAIESPASSSPINIISLDQDTQPVEKDIIEGFGKDVPLSYALASIVPPSYGYAFGKDVNPALPLTWKGGKPWDQVLDDALQSHDLVAYISDQKISIQTMPATQPSLKAPEQLKEAQALPTSSEEEVFVRRHAQGNEITATATTESNTLTSSESLESYEPSVGREVFVQRQSGNIQPYDTQETATNETSSTNEPLPNAVSSIEEESIIKKINPDIPSNVATYNGTTDNNIFEIVLSNQGSARVFDPKKIINFQAKSGQTVRNVLEKWSSQANIQVYWETPYDFPIEKSIDLTGTYPMAVQALLGRYEDRTPKPTVKLHPNWPHGPSILTVK